MAKRAGIEAALPALRRTSPITSFGRWRTRHGQRRPSRRLSETAAWLSMISFVRHVLTEYDALLEEGYEQDSARHFVADDIKAVLKEWGVKRPFGESD